MVASHVATRHHREVPVNTKLVVAAGSPEERAGLSYQGKLLFHRWKAGPANRPPLRVTRIKLEIKSPLVLNIPTYLQTENVYGNFHTEENVGCSPQKISLIPESLHNGAFGYSSARRFLDQKF